MGNNSNMSLYTFDFDSVEFPIKVSDFVFEYLYSDYRGNHLNFITKEQFRAILNGEDRSNIACKTLWRLIGSYNVTPDLPPASFDILSDEVISIKLTQQIGEDKYYEDIHKGECRYNDLVFDYEYKITRHYDAYIKFEELKRGKSVVVLKGHTFKYEDSFMHIACKCYLWQEEQIEQERIRREGEEKEKRVWIDFRMAHENELKEWLIPIIENQYKFHICQRMKNSVYGGYPEYGFVKALDRGLCGYCTGECQFKEHVLECGKHSEKWYELGLDKLKFQYLR